MKTVRRLYFYAVSLISIEVVLWGLINLLRSIVSQTVGGTAEVLARALALTVVGLPIFLFHWLWAQRLAAADDEERTASLRAIFFYGILLGTLIPLIQNLLALVKRTLLMRRRAWSRSARSSARRRHRFRQPDRHRDQRPGCPLFLDRAARRMGALPDGNANFADVRRLYRYLWVIYGLLMTIFGAQQILRFIFFVPTGLLGELGRETVVNGLALLLIGTPVWVYAWTSVQRSLSQTEENEFESPTRHPVHPGAERGDHGSHDRGHDAARAALDGCWAVRWPSPSS